MAIEEILGTDTISAGFRAKYNAAIANFITSAKDNGAGTITLFKRDGSKIEFSFNSSYLKDQTYSAEEIDLLIQAINNRGIFIWNLPDATAGVYDADIFVEHNGALYKSTVANNTVEPGIDLSDTEWTLISGSAGDTGSTNLSGPADPVSGQGTTDDWYLQETSGAWWKKELVGGVSTWGVKYTPPAPVDTSSFVAKNADIAPGTGTKVTYDAKGLIVSSSNATTDDIADSADKRYVTEDEKTKLANTSGVNTGDQDISNLVVKEAGKSLIADTEIARLAGVANLFDGTFVSLAALQAALPTSGAGHEARVDAGAGTEAVTYIYDLEDGWVLGGGETSSTFAGLTGSPTDNPALASAFGAREPAITPTTEVDFWSGAKTFLNFASTVFASVLPSLTAGTDTPILAGVTIKVALENLQAQISAIGSKIGGALSTLTTTDKTSLIAAINEVNAKPSGSGGGVSGLTPKLVTFGKSDGTLEQDVKLTYDPATDSLGINTAPEVTGGTIYFYGDSITLGIGTTVTSNRFSTVAAGYLGLTEVNQGASSSMLEKQTPELSAGNNAVDQTVGIATKVSTDRYIVLEYGINDVRYNTANFNPTNFKADFRLILNSILSKGWSASEILIVSPVYVNASQYAAAGLGGTPSPTLARHLSFNAAALEISQEYSTLYFDSYNYIKDRGGDTLINDGLHPNNAGHAMMAMGIAAILRKVAQKGHSLEVNGTAAVSNLIINKNQMLPISGTALLGVDTVTGTVGQMNTIPGLTMNGAIKANGATEPIDGLGVNDYLMKQDGILWGVFNGNNTFRNSIKMINSLAYMTFITTYFNAGFKFFVQNTIQALQINPNGSVKFFSGIIKFRRAVSNANTTLALTDYLIAYTTLTASMAVTLPAASAASGYEFVIKDESGAAGTYNITIVGTVDGVVNPVAVNTNYGSYKLYSNGTAWFTTK